MIACVSDLTVGLLTFTVGVSTLALVVSFGGRRF